MSNYPQHDKVAALGERRAAVQGFIDWMIERGYVLCTAGGDPVQDYTRARMTPEQLMAAHFGIDLKELAKEKDSLYAEFLQKLASG